MAIYTNYETQAQTYNAGTALQWHRDGDLVRIEKQDREGCMMYSNYIKPKNRPAKPETMREKTDRENRSHCKQISDNLDAYAEGCIYKCPECGEEIEFPDGVGDKFNCPHCRTVSDIDEWEQLCLYDYFSDLLDIDYIVDYQKQYKACRILVAFGGPNIYIDTHTGYVELYWWTDFAKYPLKRDTLEAVDEWAGEHFACTDTRWL